MAAAGKGTKMPDLNGRTEVYKKGKKRVPEPSNSRNKNEIIRRKLEAQRKNLPIASAEEKLVAAVKKNETLIVIGETGSGKTTQIPQFLYSAGLAKHGAIAVTQPRRVAAITVATRVAQEMGCGLGQEVGYTVRFDDVSSARTKIKYLTDGMLLREALLDPLLKKYSLVVVDEAHERTISTDVLFGVLKQVQRKRKEKTSAVEIPPLKLLVMSATLDTVQFQDYFKAPAVYIRGRQFPVEIYYSDEPQNDYLDAAVTTIFQIHLEEGSGGILVFLTGQEEIEGAERLIKERSQRLPAGTPSLAVMPIFAALPNEQQLKVFQPPPDNTRKVVLATNIAETSVTIPGISFVVDPGLVKAKCFSASLAMEALAVVPISKAQARQRSGRAGRESPGKCFRLYTKSTFDSLEESTVPEIKRCNPAGTVLQLKAMGVDDILGFDFLDKPPQSSLVQSLSVLYALGALTPRGQLSSPEGQQMAQFPLPPLLSRALLEGGRRGCAEEMASISALLNSAQSSSSLFLQPKGKEKEARAAKLRFISPFGDHLTLLQVFRAFKEEFLSDSNGDEGNFGGDEGENEGKPRGRKGRVFSWCVRNFLNFRALCKSLEIYRQIRGYCEAIKMDLRTCGEDWSTLRKCLAASFFLNAAKRQPDNTYKALANGQTVSIHPSSVMLGKKPDCVIFNEMVKTSKQYMREITEIEPEWLLEFAPHFYARKMGN